LHFGLETKGQKGHGGREPTIRAKCGTAGESNVTGVPVKENGPQSTGDHEPFNERVKGLEPSTASLEG
jgi:hypothetical protein